MAKEIPRGILIGTKWTASERKSSVDGVTVTGFTTNTTTTNHDGAHRETDTQEMNIQENPGADAKLRVDNIHYDLSEKDLKELFTRIGDIASARMTYDRHDRPTGTAFVTYYSLRDARDAVREFDGANAYGQPIRVTLLPPGPAPGARPRNPFDNVEKPSRSLFERIEHDSAPRSRRRSNSPARDGVDRYVPGRNRSPISRRGTPREGGRRPGARRENSGRPARGGARGGGEGRPGARPKKTAEELDAEMNDYWGGGAGQGDAAAVAADASTAREPQVKTVENGENPGQAAPAPINESDDIDLMVE
ncbi:hypothetical protein MBLNU457_5056t2 [Dothideomycetes sp. NU457]